MIRRLVIVILILLIPALVHATTLQDLQARWAEVNYDLIKEDQPAAFKQLIRQAQQYVRDNPNQAEGFVWLGIIQSSAAGVDGGISALSLAKKARKTLEKALLLDEYAADGSAMTTLGVLYHKVPGWPIGFGDDDKARQLLEKAVEVNPNGIDSNYFMAEFFYDKNNYQQAKHYLQLAENAPARPQHQVADRARKLDIARLMDKLSTKTP